MNRANVENLMKKIMVAGALATLVGTSAFAQSPPPPGTGDTLANSRGRVQPSHKQPRHKKQVRHAPTSAFGTVTPFGSPMQESSTGREAAVRDCNSEAAKTYAVRDSNWSLHMYRTCMARHGQPE
jgi:hypothetical protein